MGLDLVLNAWGKTYEVQFSLINNTENQVRTWPIKDAVYLSVWQPHSAINQSINQSVNYFCSYQVRRPVGSRRQNIWDGGCIEKSEIKLIKLSILGPGLFPHPSHNTIFPPNFKKNIHVCVFSKKYLLGPDWQEQKELL